MEASRLCRNGLGIHRGARGAVVNVSFLPYAKYMGLAEYAFMAGCLLAVCCGMRLIIRAFQFLEGAKPWNPWKHPSDPIIGLILGIKLRNTLVIELVGLVIAVPTILLALNYLAPPA